MKSAQATKCPGQTKEQTKLIAQGIQKGINHYKKQQKSKSRELNKKLNKASQIQSSLQENDFSNIQSQKNEKKTTLPWVLLLISWIGFVTYFFYSIFL